MNRIGIALLGLGLTAAALVLASCSDEVTTPPPNGGVPKVSLTHPDSLIQDLEESYRRREIAPYANLLAKDFKFVFQDDDVTPDIPLGFWTRTEDSTGTGALFDAVQVIDIRIDLTWFPPVSDTLNGEPVQRVIVGDTFLDVDINGGNTTLRVDGDIQHLYFRAGDPGDGENPSRLYLIEWRDVGQSVGKPSPAGVEAHSWGSIKKRFMKEAFQ